MDIQKERELFEAWVIENLADGRSMSWEGWCWKSWQAAKAQAVPKGFVVVSKERLSNAVGAIEELFEEDCTLALGELLPIQQGIKSMIEAQE